MSELRVEKSIDEAMNQRLKGNEDMYRLVCETSCDAFLYYSFETKEIKNIYRFDEFICNRLIFSCWFFSN